MPKKGYRQTKEHITERNTDEIKMKIGEAGRKRVGKLAGGWKGGITKDQAFYRRAWKNRERNVLGFHTQGEWDLLKKQYGFTCLCCKKVEPQVKLTRDHIIPLSKGGSDWIENIQPLCMPCNLRKRTKIERYA